MRRVILADRSAAYLRALAGRAQAEGIRADMELITDRERLAERLAAAPFHCVFASEEFRDLVEDLPPERRTLLTGDRDAAGPEAIFKYQAAGELMRLFRDRVNLPALNTVCSRVLIAAPEGCSGADLFAAFLAEKLAENGSVLYLNTDTFSGGFPPGEGASAPSVSELYYADGGGRETSPPAGPVRRGVTFLSPPAFPEDAESLRKADLFAAAERLYPQAFRCIVLRHSLGVLSALRHMESADAVYFPEDGTAPGAEYGRRVRAFLRERTGAERMRRVNTPVLPAGPPAEMNAETLSRLYETDWKEFIWNRAREII